MTYSIRGLDPDDFSAYRGMADDQLHGLGARRVAADRPSGYPCRVSLRDAPQGASLLLLHHVSHDVNTPYRSAYAIYVREEPVEQGHYIDEPPPVFAGRPLGLRGFGADGMLLDASLALPGRADEAIRAMFANPAIAYIHAHNAAHGCFAARIDRHPGDTA